MDFPKFLEATGLLSESGLDISAAGRLAARFSKGHTLSDLIERPPHGLSEVPTRTLERLAYAYDLHKERRGEIRRLSKAREAARKPPLPTEVLDAPTYAHSVRALERVAQTGDAIKFPSRQEWVDALVAGVELWDRCFAIAWRDSQVISGAADEDHPRAEEYAEHVRQRVEPANLPSHRWLAMRRGEREGALSLRLEAAVESLSGQVEALAPRLGDLLAERSSLDLLQEAVLGSLEEEVFRSLDQEAEIGAMWGAA